MNTTPILTPRRVRRGAAAGAAVTAVLYLLIGFEVLSIGEATGGQDAGLLGFGLMAGGSFVVVALLLILVARRLVWIAIAIWQVIVIGMYVAVASVREPPFEPWGLAIKACQLAILGSAVYLSLRGRAGAGAPPSSRAVAHR
jgi:hypothetical protein